MKSFAVLLFIAINSYASLPSQKEVRFAFQKAAIDEKSCRDLIKLLDEYNEKNSPLLAGYKASATMLMAKYSFSPITKLSNFFKGKNLLERSIAADTQNIELRYLRYIIQRKSPFFLQYKSSLKEDESILMKAVLNLKDRDLKKIIMAILRSEKALK